MMITNVYGSYVWCCGGDVCSCRPCMGTAYPQWRCHTVNVLLALQFEPIQSAMVR